MVGKKDKNKGEDRPCTHSLYRGCTRRGDARWEKEEYVNDMHVLRASLLHIYRTCFPFLLSGIDHHVQFERREPNQV